MARIATKSVGTDSVVFGFVDGSELVAVVDDLPAEMVKRLALHGLSQKIGDSYASAETIEEAVASATAVLSNLTSGVWATKSVRGGKIVEALVAFSGKPYEECLAVYAGMDDKAKAALRKHPSIKAELATIEARRAQALVDAAGETNTDDLQGLFA